MSREKSAQKKKENFPGLKWEERCVVSHIAELRARHVTSLVIATAEWFRRTKSRYFETQ